MKPYGEEKNPKMIRTGDTVLFHKQEHGEYHSPHNLLEDGDEIEVLEISYESDGGVFLTRGWCAKIGANVTLNDMHFRLPCVSDTTQTVRENNLAKHITDSGYEVPPDRLTGKTTALIHHYIWMAYNKPNVWIGIKDHVDTHPSNGYLTRKIQRVVEDLGYEHFEFTSYTNKMRFNLHSTRELKTITVDGVKYKEVV